MAETYDLVIFDCDGVLVDSERLAVRADAEALHELGWMLTDEEIVERFMGRTSSAMEDAIEAYLGGPLPEGWVDRWQRRYMELITSELTAVDGVVEALDAISTPVCVASSGSHDKMRKTLGKTGLYDRFDGNIFSATEVAEGKPAPDLFLYAAERMGVAPRNCAVIEDSKYGVQAARSAGMTAFGYAGGLSPVAWLEGENTVIFHDMRELPKLLGESP